MQIGSFLVRILIHQTPCKVVPDSSRQQFAFFQVATTGAKHDATLSDAVWHFGLPSMGETWVKQSLAAMADACDAALVDFLSVLYSRPR